MATDDVENAKMNVLELLPGEGRVPPDHSLSNKKVKLPLGYSCVANESHHHPILIASDLPYPCPEVLPSTNAPSRQQDGG